MASPRSPHQAQRKDPNTDLRILRSARAVASEVSQSSDQQGSRTVGVLSHGFSKLGTQHRRKPVCSAGARTRVEKAQSLKAKRQVAWRKAHMLEVGDSGQCCLGYTEGLC